MVKRDGLLGLAEEPLVEDVQHLQEGHVGAHVLHLVVREGPLLAALLLPPNLEC
jgi:hypothetical protein